MSDSTGVRLAAARVEIWNASAQLAARQTDAQGVARFTSAELEGATAGLVRRIGFAPARFSLPAPTAVVEIRLTALAQSIPALTISAANDACPQADDAAAREMWQRTAARYQRPSVEGRWSHFEQQTGNVAERDVGTFEDRALGTGSRGYTSAGMRGGTRRIEQRGYVYALPPSHQLELFGAWQYPALDAELAGTFATDAFAAAHTFRLSSRSASAVVLRFCARDRSATGLDGTIRLSESGGFLDARWRFWNPAPGGEPAGGEISIAPTSRDGVPAPLIATSGLFWRRLPSGRYIQRWQQFSEWRFESATIP